MASAISLVELELILAIEYYQCGRVKYYQFSVHYNLHTQLIYNSMSRTEVGRGREGKGLKSITLN